MSIEDIKKTKNILSRLISKIFVTEDRRDESKWMERRIQSSRDYDEIAKFSDEFAGLVNEVIDELRGKKGGSGKMGAQDIKKFLLSLIEKTPFPESMDSELDLLKIELRSSAVHDAAYNERLIEKASSLLTKVRVKSEEEKKDLQVFLQKLTGRLTEIEKGLYGIEDVHQASFKSGRLFDRDIKGGISQIRDTIDAASDMGGLKSDLDTRIAALQTMIESYRDSEEDRALDGTEQLQRLQIKMLRMQEEVKELKQQLHEERMHAMTDTLTGVPNRMAYDKKLNLELSSYEQNGDPFSLLVVDIDKFKSINDTYGHKAGDAILRDFARILFSVVRKSDMVARYGGEEFAVILSGANSDDAARIAEKLRSSVEEYVFSYNGKVIPVTASFGIHEAQKKETAETMFEKADRALYEAKRSGRNRCCMYSQALGADLKNDAVQGARIASLTEKQNEKRRDRENEKDGTPAPK